jgi:hypothetical protein
MSISKQRPRDHHKRRQGAAALVGFVALTAAMAVSLPYFNAGNAATGAQTAGKRQPTGDVLLEPVGFAGANPFGPAVGLDVAGVVPPSNLGGTQPGDRLGLFGGTERHASCNPAGQIAYLQANPDKAVAFASVLGITPADLPGVIAALTPAILRSDTAVINHGFVNGQATSFPAVLQAGTAVLLDKFGFPVTKCFCGNPLTRPVAFEQPRFIGAPWITFSVTQITFVVPAPAVINQFVLVEPTTGQAFVRTSGTDGQQDQPAPPASLPPPDTAAPSAVVPPSGVAPPSTTTGRARPSSASWAVGNCFAEASAGGSALNATVQVRNNDTVAAHSYQVTVSFGSLGQAIISVAGVRPAQVRQAKVSAMAAGPVPTGPVACEITKVVDENGQQVTQGPPLPPPTPTTGPTPPSTGTTTESVPPPPRPTISPS